MTLWFAASAVVPQLTEQWGLDDAGRSWLTMSVQLGFVAGALLIAVLNLADRIPVRLLIAACALIGAVANAVMVLFDESLAAAIGSRFVTGMALAGVYPPGMKLVVTWCQRDRGVGIGVLIGALSIGSAMPHLANGVPLLGESGMPPWRSVILASSGMATASAILMVSFVRPGPHHGEVAPFDWRFAGRALAHLPTRLANYGYLGHMWELYAMWTWVPMLLIASYGAAELPVTAARIAGFATIAAGAIGCVIAGVLADRIGRATVAAWSLAISGSCAMVAGLLFDEPIVLTVVCLLWGIAVVADSAQFSAAVSELTDPRYIGTALTVQTCLGFLLTLVTIRVVPPMVDAIGWRWVFVLLVPGPVFGIWSMLRLKRLTS